MELIKDYKNYIKNKLLKINKNVVDIKEKNNTNNKYKKNNDKSKSLATELKIQSIQNFTFCSKNEK
jgi:hypothetical protein